MSPFTREYFRHSFQPINPHSALVNLVTGQDPEESDKKMATYKESGPVILARTRQSVVVSYSSVKAVEFLSGFNGNVVRITYSDRFGKNRRLDVRLDPRVDMVTRVKFPRDAIEGVKKSGDHAYFTKETNDEICRQIDAAKEEYIESVKRLLLSCLPSSLVLTSKGFL